MNYESIYGFAGNARLNVMEYRRISLSSVTGQILVDDIAGE